VISGFWGRAQEKFEAVADRVGLPGGYESLEELVGGSGVHSVHVNTPKRFHLPQAAAANCEGKHVMARRR